MQTVFLRYLLLLVCLANLAACSIVSVAPAQFKPNQVIQQSQSQLGPNTEPAVHQWHDFLSTTRPKSELKQLHLVNDYVNEELFYDDDKNIWADNDYWATPLESFTRKRADCEDFVIAKYFSLRFAGVPAQRLRIAYVKVRVGNWQNSDFRTHMVLAYYPPQSRDPLILDNLLGTILPASRRDDIKLVFAFNAKGIWLDGDNIYPSNTERIGKLADVMARMEQEGFRLN